MAGKSDLLKERTLGVEVFDRSPSYDTNADTVVRYTAGEVRKRLLLFYHEDGRDSSIRISLPAGSYIPEFLHGQDRAEETGVGGGYEARHFPNAEGFDERASKVAESALVTQPGMGDRSHRPLEITGSIQAADLKSVLRLLPLAVMAVLIVLVAVAGYMWKSQLLHPSTTVDEFWAPILRDQKTVVICTGSSVFAQNPYSGLITAGTNRDLEYPFVSMQSAAAIAEIEASMEGSGIKTQLIASPLTNLTNLREHSMIPRWRVQQPVDDPPVASIAISFLARSAGDNRGWNAPADDLGTGPVRSVFKRGRLCRGRRVFEIQPSTDGWWRWPGWDAMEPRPQRIS